LISTRPLANWVGATTATLMPLVEAIRAHIFAAARWPAVRRADPSAAMFLCWRDSCGHHPDQHCHAQSLASLIHWHNMRFSSDQGDKETSGVLRAAQLN
jgi:hypothetical protein